MGSAPPKSLFLEEDMPSGCCWAILLKNYFSLSFMQVRSSCENFYPIISRAKIDPHAAHIGFSTHFRSFSTKSARKRHSDEDILRLLREIEVNLHDGMGVSRVLLSEETGLEVCNPLP